jgi:hypothetical protein
MKLLALRCPNCEQPLTPENEHLVTLCPECQTAVSLADDGLSPVEIHYATPPKSATVTEWQPFWIFEGQVNIRKRETQGGGSSGKKAAAQLWDQPRRFYVPAWDLSLSTAQDLGSRMVQQQPVFAAGPQPAHPNLLPITVSAEDTQKLLEFIVLAIEARRDDWLKNLEFQLKVGPPAVWALPAEK